MKKTIAIVLAVLMLISGIPITASATTIVANGICGDNLTWTFDEEGTLTISGAGAMYDYSTYGNKMPWENYKSSINNLVFEEGITYIGENSFYDCPIKGTVIIPDSVTNIGEYAFSDCDNLTDVYYAGSECQWKQINIASTNDSLANATIHFAASSEHAYQTVITLPTCAEQGYTTYTCECGDSYVADYVEPTGEHDWYVSSLNHISPCDGGTIFSFCRNMTCRAVKEEYIEPLGHDYQFVSDNNATCTQDGTMHEECSRCHKTTGETVVEEGSKLAHDYTETKILTQQTCTQDGVSIQICKDCSYVATSIAGAYGHYDSDGDGKCDECKVVLEVIFPEIPSVPEETTTEPEENTTETPQEPATSPTEPDIPDDSNYSNASFEIVQDGTDLKLYAKNCVDLGVIDFRISFPTDVVSKIRVITGYDAKQVNSDNFSNNSFAYESNTASVDNVLINAYFEMVLWTSEKFVAEAFDDVDINGEYFHLLTFKLTLNDAFSADDISVSSANCSVMFYDNSGNSTQIDSFPINIIYQNNDSETTTEVPEEATTVPEEPTIEPEGTTVHTHSFSREVIVEPGCVTAGEQKFTCSCGESYSATISANGHTDENADSICDVCTEDLSRNDADSDADSDAEASDFLSKILEIFKKIVKLFKKLFNIA